MALAASSPAPLAPADAPLRRVWHFIPLALIAFSATLLAISPRALDSTLALALGLFLVFLFPGHLAAKILDPAAQTLSLTRLPLFFVYSLALWAMPATALQLVGANWFTFRVSFVALLWILLVAAFVRAWRNQEKSPPLPRAELIVELLLALVCALVAVLVANGSRDADDWLYLQVTQQFIGSERFQIFAASEARYSVRYAFHVWIFLQAYLGQWLNVDVVRVLRQILPVLIAPLGLIGFYAWGKTFFGNARAALLAVGVQLVIYLTFFNDDGWGRGFFDRSAQDKFLVWLIILPVALLLAWNFLHAGKFTTWLAYGATMIAGLWVHPVSLFLVVLSLGGFALFNLLSRTPFSRRRWLYLTIASLPALLSPIVIRATTLPSVFTVNTPDVAANVRLSVGRLLFQPPFYLNDPALVAQPILLCSFVLLVLFASRWRTDLRTQFMWGSTLVPLALLYNPYTARILGEMLTPWQLWRMTWGLPVAFIITETIWQRRALGLDTWSPARVSIALILLVSFALSLSLVNPERALFSLHNNQLLDPSVQGVMESLRTTLHAPANVLLPRRITRYASAYTYNAVLMTNDAQKQEDARGKQIDRFYNKKADPKFLEAFLDFWKSDYVVVPKSSLQEQFVSTRAGSLLQYQNTDYSLWHVKQPN